MWWSGILPDHGKQWAPRGFENHPEKYSTEDLHQAGIIICSRSQKIFSRRLGNCGWRWRENERVKEREEDSERNCHFFFWEKQKCLRKKKQNKTKNIIAGYLATMRSSAAASPDMEFFTYCGVPADYSCRKSLFMGDRTDSLKFKLTCTSFLDHRMKVREANNTLV